MANFRDYTSPSSKLRYLIIETEDGIEQIKLLVQTSQAGRYAASWPPLRNSIYVENWTLEHKSISNPLSKMWSLQALIHRHVNIARTLPNLGSHIIQGEVHWGNTTTIEGKYRHIPGYWEWDEDVLGGSQQTLSTIKIYDAVYASLFTYDRNSNILQAFCEAWCPKKNTLLTSAGELSISLWDLHILGGLPIAGSPYEEAVTKTRVLIGLDEKQIRFIPRSCEYLFAASHHLKEGTGATQKVSFSKWTSFWYKKTLINRPAPLRKEKKSARLKSIHNPNGVIPETTRWSSDQETIFSKLRVRSNKKDETYVVAFLSIWLCAFGFPKVENSIRPETFKMASMMAGERKISLVVPDLASIYHGLNKISRSYQLDQVKVSFPFIMFMAGLHITSKPTIHLLRVRLSL